MAWNEPGGGKDPWGGNRNDQGPPDIDEALKKLKEKLGFFGGGGGSSSGSSGGGNLKSLVPMVIVGLVLVWAFLGFYQVDEKENAVVLRLGEYSETIEDSGLKWNPPLIDKVYTVGVTEERQYSTRGLMLTQDENIVEVALAVQYNIASAKDFVLSIRSPETTLKQATDSALRHVVGSTGLDGVISDQRTEVADGMTRKLQDLLDLYSSGINIVKINIEDARPPNQVKAAYDDVIEAREDLERLVNEAQAYSNGVIPEARGQAAKIVREAEGYRERVIKTAEGDAKRFSQQYSEYKKAPDITRKRLYLETMEEILPTVKKFVMDNKKGNGVLPILPLGGNLMGGNK